MSGRNWGNATFWHPAERVFAIVEALLYPSIRFTKLIQTEIIDGVTNPHFVTRVSLPALEMQNSQAAAIRSVIRVRAFSRGVEIGIADVSLASLIYDGFHDGALSASGISPFCSGRTNKASVTIAVLTSCRDAQEEKMKIDPHNREGHRIKFSVWLDPSFMESVQGESEITLSVSGERGRWVQVGSAGTVLKGSAGRRVGRIEVLRKDLTTALEKDRELRIAVADVRKGLMTVVGFVQFELRKLAAKQWAEWRFTRRQGLTAAVRVKKYTASPSSTDINLEIGVNRAVLRDGPGNNVENQSSDTRTGLMSNLPIDFWRPLAGALNEAAYGASSRRKRVVAPKHVVKFPGTPSKEEK